MWLCVCSCGNTTIIQSAKIGDTKSCGCLISETIKKLRTTHGKTGTPEYRTWTRIIERCSNPNNHNFTNYGGRGIRVCKQWSKFENFLKDMRSRPSKDHSIDRINTNGDYCPSNCRWATNIQQQNNKRNNKYITISGTKLTQAQWERKNKLSHGAICLRISHGWTPEEAAMTPMDKSKQRFSR